MHHTFMNFATIHHNSRKEIIAMYIPGSLINPVGRQPVFNDFFPYYQSQTRREGKRMMCE